MTHTSPASVNRSSTDVVIDDLARCEFHFGGAKIRVIFAPSAEISRLNETLPPSDWMELIYANLDGPGLFQVQIRPESRPADSGAEIALDGQSEHSA